MYCRRRSAGRISRGSRRVSDTRADDISLLHGLVAIASVHPHEGEAVAYLCGEMAGRGFRTCTDEAGNAIGEIGDGPLHIVMLGHIDTVPGVVPVRIDGDNLYGRGSVDAKGPLATFVAATAKAHRDGLLDGLKVTVIGGTGEEAHSPGANYLATTMPAPDACIIGDPGAWESIVLGYKGSMQLRYELAQANSHGAGQQKPATQIAVDVWNAIVAYGTRLNEGIVREFDRVEPTLRAFDSENDGLTQRAWLEMNVRVPISHMPDDLYAAFVALLDGRGTLTAGESFVPPYRCDKNTPLVRALLAGVRATGGTPRFKVKTGTADMNVVGPVWKCQMAAYGPGDSAQDHTPDEHLSLVEYVQAVDALAAALGAMGRG